MNDRLHIHDICDHATYDRNQHGPKGPKDDQWPCAICGMGVVTHGARTTHWVHMKTDGHLLRHGDTVSDAEDFGCHVIGPECYKRNRIALEGYVTRHKLSETGMKTEQI